MASDECYLAGRMRGMDPEVMTLLFKTGAEKLRRRGWRVFSPLEHDAELGISYDQATVEASTSDLRKALADDTHFICLRAAAVYLLPGWEESAGARAEAALGEALGIAVVRPMLWFYDEPSVDGADLTDPTPRSIRTVSEGNGWDVAHEEAKHLKLRNQHWNAATRGYVDDR